MNDFRKAKKGFQKRPMYKNNGKNHYIPAVVYYSVWYQNGIKIRPECRKPLIHKAFFDL